MSVVILTFNEEINIARCLASVSWCDDVLVIDSGSTDATCAIARSHGARVITRPFDHFAGQRNFALEQGLAHAWVLHLDADEEVTPDLRAMLQDLSPREDVDGYRIPSKTMLFDRWLRRAGMYPTYQVRLSQRDRMRFVQVGHGQREAAPPERIATLDVPYLHYAFSHGMAHWLRKHILYARDEAKLIVSTERRFDWSSTVLTDRTERRRALKWASGFVPLWMRPPARFFYILVARQGILDGRAGLAYATMMAAYEAMTAVFVYEAKLGGSQGAGALSR